MANIAVGTIKLYRRYLSPLKGFRCAHNALHACGSCSDFGLRAFHRHSLLLSWRLIRLRFAACKAAHVTIIAMAGSVPDMGDPKRGELPDKPNPYRPGSLGCPGDTSSCGQSVGNVGCEQFVSHGIGGCLDIGACS
jgi:putative component of membrane protein insertase Oxa1/YidC/SpoIIIJ protein YidD